MQACYNMIVAVIPRLTWSGARLLIRDSVPSSEQCQAIRPSPAPQSANIPCTDQSRHDFPVCI
jgi:hypothetical protein